MSTKAAPGKPTSNTIDRRRFLISGGLGAMAVLAAPALLTACDSTSESTGGDGEPSGSQGVTKLNWAMAGLPSMSMAAAFSTDVACAQRLVCESLLVYGPDFAMQNQLADSVDRQDDKHYLVKVKSGISFSDGSELTADDVVASWKFHMDPKNESQLNSYMAPIADVKSSGTGEVQFELSEPTAFMDYLMVMVFILPAAVIQQYGKKLGSPDALPIGTGPYKVTNFVPDQSASFVRNDKYDREKPSVETVEIAVIGDSKARTLAAQSGDIDGTFDVGVNEPDIDGFTTTWVPSLGSTFIAFGLKNKLWQDVHVRRAVGHCLDRGPLVNGLLKGKGQAALSLVPPQQWGALLPADQVGTFYDTIAPPAYDIELAKQELAQSTVPDGFSFEMIYPSVIPEDGKVLQALAENLKQLNVVLTVKEVSIDEYYGQMGANEGTSAMILDFAPSYPDPADYPVLCFDPAAAVPNAYNIAHWTDPKMGALLKTYTAATEDSARIDTMKQILTQANDELAYLPIWWRQTGLVLDNSMTYAGFNGFYYYDNFAVSVT